MLSVKLEFLTRDTKWFFTYFTLDCPIEDIIRNLRNSVGECICWDNLLNFSEWNFIIRPVEKPSPNLSQVERSKICLIQCITPFCFWRSTNGGEGSHRIILLCDRLVVPKRTHFWREKYSPFSSFLHMLYDFQNHFFIVLFFILFIEDTQGLMIESDTSKEVLYSIAMRRIKDSMRVRELSAKKTPVSIGRSFNF